jgi:hypothetical protein
MSELLKPQPIQPILYRCEDPFVNQAMEAQLHEKFKTPLEPGKIEELLADSSNYLFLLPTAPFKWKSEGILITLLANFDAINGFLLGRSVKEEGQLPPTDRTIDLSLISAQNQQQANTLLQSLSQWLERRKYTQMQAHVPDKSLPYTFLTNYFGEELQQEELGIQSKSQNPIYRLTAPLRSTV